MFNKIFVERGIRDHPQTRKILSALQSPAVHLLDKVEDVFGRSVKPYQQKKTTLNLFIGKKEGRLVKKTPPAYGASSDNHYFFYHSYNCIFSCEYCYLQGYFSSPDLVFFINHDEICTQIESLCSADPHHDYWFHSGEFSDSLALTHITKELPIYWQTFSKLTNGYLELRTKSANIGELLQLSPLPNIVVSFSLSPKEKVATFERHTSPLHLRLRAIKKLADYGYQIGIHLDPIIYSQQLSAEYHSLLCSLRESVSNKQLAYVSLGVVRFSKEVFNRVKKNYPTSTLLAENFSTRTDGKVSYFRPKRLFTLNLVKEQCLKAGIPEARIYFCMEK